MSNQPTKFAIESGLEVFNPKTFEVDDTFDYFVGKAEPPIKHFSNDPNAVLLKSELKLLEQTAVRHALNDIKVKPFARIGSEKEGRTRRFLARRTTEKEAVANDEMSEKVYSAVVSVWEGRGCPPDALDAVDEDEDDPSAASGDDDHGSEENGESSEEARPESTAESAEDQPVSEDESVPEDEPVSENGDQETVNGNVNDSAPMPAQRNLNQGYT